MPITIYLQLFFRIVISLTFMLSFWGKINNFQLFSKTITNFDVLPKRLSSSLAFLLLVSELTITCFLLLTDPLPTLGFIAALILLVIFTIGIIINLLRGSKINCNCFGMSAREISIFDIARNCILIIFVIGGLLLPSSAQSFSPVMILVIFPSVLIILFYYNISHFYRFIFRK